MKISYRPTASGKYEDSYRPTSSGRYEDKLSSYSVWIGCTSKKE